MKLTETERIAKKILEDAGWIVVKPSWPDFLIYNSINPVRYCFVEVKRGSSEHISKGQLETGSLLKELGFSYSLFMTEEETSSLVQVAKASQYLKHWKLRS